MKEKLISLEQVLTSLYPSYVDRFNDGISLLEIEKIERETNILLNPETKLLYEWKNGIKIQWDENIAELALFRLGIFLPLSEACEAYKVNSLNEKLWPAKYFPIFFSGWGDFFLVCLNGNISSGSSVYFYSPTLFAIEPVTIFDSLPRLVSCISEAYQKHLLFRDENNDLVIEDEYFDFMKARNPMSDYWKNNN